MVGDTYQKGEQMSKRTMAEEAERLLLGQEISKKGTHFGSKDERCDKCFCDIRRGDIVERDLETHVDCRIALVRDIAEAECVVRFYQGLNAKTDAHEFLIRTLEQKIANRMDQLAQLAGKDWVRSAQGKIMKKEAMAKTKAAIRRKCRKMRSDAVGRDT
jgi:hypothetical protein